MSTAQFTVPQLSRMHRLTAFIAPFVEGSTAGLRSFAKNIDTHVAAWKAEGSGASLDHQVELPLCTELCATGVEQHYAVLSPGRDFIADFKEAMSDWIDDVYGRTGKSFVTLANAQLEPAAVRLTVTLAY